MQVRRIESMPKPDIDYRRMTPRPRTNHGQPATEMVIFMGYSKKRANRDGRPRYTACYLDARGFLRSAGTFSSKKDADKAWQKAEMKLGEGRLSDPRRGKQTFRR